MFKLLIAVPTFETIDPGVFKAIYDLDIPALVSSTEFEFVRGYDCARARNAIAQKAVDGGFDYVLMVDSDTIIPKDTLTRFFERDPGSVMLGIYPKKYTSGQTEIFSFATQDYTDANRYSFATFNDEMESNQAHRIRVKGGGLGCALIDVDIFNRIPKPWFLYITYPNGEALSEDLYFCEQVQNVEGTISVDPRVRCGHVGKYTKYE